MKILIDALARPLRLWWWGKLILEGNTICVFIWVRMNTGVKHGQPEKKKPIAKKVDMNVNVGIWCRTRSSVRFLSIRKYYIKILSKRITCTTINTKRQ